MAVINMDDPRGADILERWAGKALRTSLDSSSEADVAPLSSEYSLDGLKAKIRTPKGEWEISTALIGAHNLSNCLVAIGMALAMGFSRSRITRGLSALERVPGRLEPIYNDQGKHVFVDYAHSPDALARTLEALRPLTTGRLVAVFGAGGDRDRSKRTPMGRVVGDGCDLVVVTNDNPRSEDPEAIAKAICSGLDASGWRAQTHTAESKTYLVELDRRSALKKAVSWLGPDDILVAFGKGHETYQMMGETRRPFDDRAELRHILNGTPLLYSEAGDAGNKRVEQLEATQGLDDVEIVHEVQVAKGEGASE